MRFYSRFEVSFHVYCEMSNGPTPTRTTITRGRTVQFFILDELRTKTLRRFVYKSVLTENEFPLRRNVPPLPFPGYIEDS